LSSASAQVVCDSESETQVVLTVAGKIAESCAHVVQFDGTYTKPLARPTFKPPPNCMESELALSWNPDWVAKEPLKPCTVPKSASPKMLVPWLNFETRFVQRLVLNV
jgi:hypothetical protein